MRNIIYKIKLCAHLLFAKNYYIVVFKQTGGLLQSSTDMDVTLRMAKSIREDVQEQISIALTKQANINEANKIINNQHHGNP